MNPTTLYHYKMDRKQQSKLFINMGVACLLYIAGLYGYESFADKSLSENFRKLSVIGLSVSSIILFAIAWWHRTHPGTYEALITSERFTVTYPGSRQWSFDIKTSDIKRFEHRNTHSHAGNGISRSGVLLHDGSFHEISMNYGNSIKEMHRAVQSILPDIAFPKTLNKKVSGPLAKDYDP